MYKYKECLALETLLSKVSPLPSTFLLKLRLPSTSDTQLLVVDLDLSVELGEGRERHAPRQLATNILSCFGIVRVIPLARVQMGDPRFKIWDVSVDEIFIILLATLWLNCSTCFLMYFRKASLDQRPIIMIT